MSRGATDAAGDAQRGRRASPSAPRLCGSGGGRFRPGARHASPPAGTAAHEALLVLDIETVPDTDLIPSDWPSDRFPKCAWHRIVTISFVVAELARAGGAEVYAVAECRSGGEAIPDERRLLAAFWRFFASRRFRVVTWNGRRFDMPTILARSLMHGLDASPWFLQGDRWNGYRHRYGGDWHVDLMDAMSEHGATPALTLEEAAAALGLPGKLGEHGSKVAAMMEAGEVGRVRAYCETDTLNLAVLYIRWAFLTGRTDAVSHDRAVADMIAYLEAERAARPHLGRFLDEWRAMAGRRPPFVGAQG